eukprot:11772526-Heterocapsa_arctica.AAC.1
MAEGSGPASRPRGEPHHGGLHVTTALTARGPPARVAYVSSIGGGPSAATWLGSQSTGRAIRWISHPARAASEAPHFS